MRRFDELSGVVAEQFPKIGDQADTGGEALELQPGEFMVNFGCLKAPTLLAKPTMLLPHGGLALVEFIHGGIGSDGRRSGPNEGIVSDHGEAVVRDARGEGERPAFVPNSHFYDKPVEGIFARHDGDVQPGSNFGDGRTPFRRLRF